MDSRFQVMTKSKQIQGLKYRKSSLQSISQVIELYGTESAILQAKDYLTVKNDSVFFEIKNLKKKKHRLEGRLSSNQAMMFSPDLSDSQIVSLGKKERKINEEIYQIDKEIDELEDKAVAIMYADNDDGSITVPFGYWYLAESGDGYVENSEVGQTIQDLEINGKKARPVQIEALKALLKNKNGTVALATGIGKSFIINALCLLGVRSGIRVCVVVSSTPLVHQMYQEIKKSHDSVAMAGDGIEPAKGKDILVTTVHSAKKYISGFYQMLLFDEAHHVPSSTWMEVFECCDFKYAYNLTATPFRNDGMDKLIFSYGGPIVYSRDIKWGIEQEVLENFDVYRIEDFSYDKDGQAVNTGKFANNVQANIRLLTKGDFVERRIIPHILSAVEKGRSIIVMTVALKPAKMIRALLKGHGVDAGVADAEFKHPLRQFQKGETKILIATNRLIGEGVDIPSADVLFLLTQHKSEIITFQAVGRIIRTVWKDGKRQKKIKPVVIDCTVKGYLYKDGDGKTQDRFKRYGEFRKKIWSYAADNVIDIKV